MSEMIERAAKALFNGAQKKRTASQTNELLYGRSDVTWEFINSEDVVPSIADDYRSQARAAIAAMREPTEEMKSCSEEVHWGYSCHVCGGLKEGWYAMIDAALGNVDAITG